MLIVFIIFQKQIIDSFAISGAKGDTFDIESKMQIKIPGIF